MRPVRVRSMASRRKSTVPGVIRTGNIPSLNTRGPLLTSPRYGGPPHRRQSLCAAGAQRTGLPDPARRDCEVSKVQEGDLWSL